MPEKQAAAREPETTQQTAARANRVARPVAHLLVNMIVEANMDHLNVSRAGGASIASRAIPSIVVAGGTLANGASLTFRAAGPVVAMRMISVPERSRGSKCRLPIRFVLKNVTNH